MYFFLSATCFGVFFLKLFFIRTSFLLVLPVVKIESELSTNSVTEPIFKYCFIKYQILYLTRKFLLRPFE